MITNNYRPVITVPENFVVSDDGRVNFITEPWPPLNPLTFPLRRPHPMMPQVLEKLSTAHGRSGFKLDYIALWDINLTQGETEALLSKTTISIVSKMDTTKVSNLVIYPTGQKMAMKYMEHSKLLLIIEVNFQTIDYDTSGGDSNGLNTFNIFNN